MKNDKKHVSKEIILEITLSLIDKNEGIKNVTLRDIAKKVGCAHTNLYNYFSSLDEIFWEALGQVLLMMMDYSSNGMSDKKDDEERFFLILSNLIDFSMEHPGWYRFIWFESIGGNPSPEVTKILNKPGEGFSDLIKMSNKNIPNERANYIGNILHSYLHGELCKWINNRSFINTREETKAIILSNLKYLYKLLIQ
ncbi:TetR/AcrR family transcriptional regulator [Clostridium sp. MSJ-11]|uniref:TetR/AcrR family transcriptional regulator n=1 Tax=Clostridium mobile TaxID=2841512 RepID=A0ABS6EMY9_9CLOT|nr:TetR/AcrR family transcriptional regulator [Clostridium mobile]MBU5486011.1 TetR/AcrR family transcriptional regulator [Clostridium mobile]